MSSVVSFLFGGGETVKTYQRLGELQKQTAKEAEPRPVIWGRVRPVSGNVIHASQPKRKMVEAGRTTTGGKGGGGGQTTIQYEERVFRTYAIRICEGPITDIVRVWRNDKLVYDARGNEWGDKNNPAFLRKAKFYLGGWGQMPDPVLEAICGVGNVPAYRGTCYMRVDNEDLTDFGGRVPQFVFEVQRTRKLEYLTTAVYENDSETTAVYATSEVSSKRYPLDPFRDSGQSAGGSVLSGELRQVLQSYSVDPESSQAGASTVVSGEFRQALRDYGYTEEAESTGATVVSAEFRQALKDYTVDPESAESTGGNIVSGEFRLALIQYDNWPVESAESTGGVITSAEHG